MTWNDQNVPLVEINKNSGAHQKNLNEDRFIAAKCRPMILVATNIRYMRGGSIGVGGVSISATANGLRAYSVAYLY